VSVDFKKLSSFVKIIDTGSMSRAANTLRIAQPALSQQVAALEAHFKQKLLLRSNHGVAPTEAGFTLYRHAQAMLKQLEISGPLVGFLTQNARVRSGASVSLAGWAKPVAEPEIAVHIGHDVPAGADRDTAAAAIAGISPAIELVDVHTPPQDPERILGENIYQRHVVLSGVGPARAGASSDGLTCRIMRHGKEFARTTDPQANTGQWVEIVRHVAKAEAPLASLAVRYRRAQSRRAPPAQHPTGARDPGAQILAV